MMMTLLRLFLVARVIYVVSNLTNKILYIRVCNVTNTFISLAFLGKLRL